MSATIKHLVNNIFGAIEIIFVARIAFRALQANPAALVVDIVYHLTDILISPVQYIFPNIPVGGSVFDVVAICAMIFYAIVYFLIGKLIRVAAWAE